MEDILIMRKVTLYFLCFWLNFLSLSNTSAQQAIAIKCFKKMGKATPWELVQAVDSLFEQNPQLRIPSELIAIYHSRSRCNQLRTIEEKQRCYYQQETENSTISEDMWRRVSRIPPIGTFHSFRLSNNSDTVVHLGIGNSVFYRNRYADFCLISYYLLRENISYGRMDLSRKQRKCIAQRFEAEIIRKIEKILKDNQDKK
jgi:hypothetical protein